MQNFSQHQGKGSLPQSLIKNLRQYSKLDRSSQMDIVKKSLWSLLTIRFFIQTKTLLLRVGKKRKTFCPLEFDVDLSILLRKLTAGWLEAIWAIHPCTASWDGPKWSLSYFNGVCSFMERVCQYNSHDMWGFASRLPAELVPPQLQRALSLHIYGF